VNIKIAATVSKMCTIPPPLMTGHVTRRMRIDPLHILIMGLQSFPVGRGSIHSTYLVASDVFVFVE